VTPLIRASLLAAIVLLATASAAAAPPLVRVRSLAKTDLRLGGITSTGGHLLYIAENTGQIEESGLAGLSMQLPPTAAKHAAGRCSTLPRMACARTGCPPAAQRSTPPDAAFPQLAQPPRAIPAARDLSAGGLAILGTDGPGAVRARVEGRQTRDRSA
jgi:hypothetical protein